MRLLVASEEEYLNQTKEVKYSLPFNLLFYSILFYSILFYSLLFSSLLFSSLLFSSLLAFFSSLLFSSLLLSPLPNVRGEVKAYPHDHREGNLRRRWLSWFAVSI